MPPTAINLSEIFASIQGEGRFLGEPSIFLRTSGCNLRCKWGNTLCDTPYTSWTPEKNILSLDAVMAAFADVAECNPEIRHVIVTGGEPLLQKHITVLVTELHQLDYHITIETNGTIAKQVEADFISLSPKLSSSTPYNTRFERPHAKIRHKPDALRFWCANYDYQLKFVVDEQDDEREIQALIEVLNLDTTGRVYVMPQGVTSAQLATNARLCVALCLKNGWRYSPRTHIAIFGNTRGT